MGSGSSKKSSQPQPTKLSSASSRKSSSTSASSSATMSSSRNEGSGINQNKPAEESSPTTGSLTVKEPGLKLQRAGLTTKSKQLAKWETYNVDELMQALDGVDRMKQWYDVIDMLINDQSSAVTPNTKRKGWRTVRLFISSTFKDMHSEREHLVKLIIPVLRQWCTQRKLNLIECDLRWGVPKDADTRETLLTCLSEIDRCREENEYSYFLSMLSERYGYVMDPSQVPDDIKARYKWLPGINPNALFMMRKPSFLQRLDEDIRGAYAESDPSAIESLAVLKEKVKSHFPHHVKEYDCNVEGREGSRAILGGLEQFGQTILDFFKARISEQYPPISEEEEMSLTEIKRANQEEFMLQRSQVLLGRDREVREIENYLHKDTTTTPATKLLALVGYPGAGKSALMAFTAKRCLDQPSSKVFFHFVGVTPDSTSVYSVLSRLYRECMPEDQQDSMPLDSDDMARFAPTMFEEATAETLRLGFKRLVVFLDALNQLDDKGKAHKLTWLPRQLPKGMRVVVSTLEGGCLDSLRNHSNPAQEVAVNPLSEEVRKCIVQERLQPYNKRLDDEQLKILVSKPDAGRPLFLSIACEELRIFGEFRKLTSKIQNLSDELSGLVEIVLRRTVEEFGGELVQATLCLIETSHFGLEEEELLHLLSAKPVLPSPPADSSPSHFQEKLPMALWGFVYVGLRSFLRPSGSAGEGRVDFYHRTISKVVRKMYLTDPQEAAKWHGRLIQYFNGCSSIARKAEELPYHYIAVDNTDGLRRCLLERSMFEYLYTQTNKQQLMQYWIKAGGYPLAAASYQQALKDYITLDGLEGTTEGEELAMRVAWFLVDIGEYDAASDLLDNTVAQISQRHGPQAVQLADPLHATMELLMRKGLKFVYGSHPGYQECVTKGRKLVDLTVKIHRQRYPADSNALGNMLSLCGYFKSSLLEECRTIFTNNNNKVGLAVVLYTLAEKNQYHNDINVPMKLFKESLALCKVYFGLYHLNTARCVQLYGQLYWNTWITNSRQDYLEECLGHYIMELDILREILGQDHPTTVRSREDVIIVLKKLGRDAEAEKLLAEQPDTRDGIARVTGRPRFTKEKSTA
ncbi:hypothetical protein ACOMHN_065168 [Nucella lapillus]